MKTKQKKIAAYDIFRKSEDPAYPEMLAKFIQDADNYEYEVEKAEYLLNLWIEDYKDMPQIDKSIYYTIIPKFLKRLFSAFTNRGKGAHTLTIMYFLQYKKWQQLTDYIQKGLNKSQLKCLTILWNLSQKLVQTIQKDGVPECDPYGQFLSQQFQQPLSNYKWKCHEQKMYILQTVKFLNAHFQYQPFIEHGQKWLNIIKSIQQQPFKSEISKQKGQLKLQLYKFVYHQKKNELSDLQKTAISGGQKSPRKTKNQPKQKDKYELQKQKQFQKQFLSKQQINMFLVVKDEKQQKQIYRLQILNQIINIRSLICKISEQYWDKLAYNAVQEIHQRMEDLNYLIRTDVLLSRLFLSLLKYKKTAAIIRQKIGQQIVVKIIKNIQFLQKNSPFQNPQLSQIPTLVNQVFFYITHEMSSQGVTIQSIINKRIKSIIDHANAGKDDIINRALMTVSCRQQMRLRKASLNDIIQFLINIKKKKGVSIQTCIILVKILLSSIRSPQLKQLEIFLLVLAVTQLTQVYQLQKKVNQLRKLCILLQSLLIPLLKIDFTQQGILVDAVLKWLQIVQNNFHIVFAPMIKILTILIDKYKDYYNSQQKAVDVLQKILTGINQKLGHEHNNENMFAFLECILKGYIKLNWSTAYTVYQDIPSGSFIDWEIIYKKQARIIFKKQDQIKIKQKQAQLQAKLAKQRQWNNTILKRKQTIARINKQQKKTDGTVYIDIQKQQKKCQQKMGIYFGQQQKQWLKQLINDHFLWRRQNIMRSQFGCLQFSLIQTVNTVQKQFYIKTQRPNQFIKRLIKQLDQDIYNLFVFLMQEQSYQLLFLFASKIFFLCRDFFYVKTLKSYRLIQSRCFQILSIFFNKVQILYASSFFCSLLIPYANDKRLKQVYDDLNQQQFITDLFKGSNQFIGKQKCYYPWLIKILMAYQLTEEFRVNMQLVKQSLISLGKNVIWWGYVQYLINAQIQIYQHDDQAEENKIITNVNFYSNDNNFKDLNQNYINKRLIFDLFKEQYKKLMDQYFSRIQKLILLKKQQQIMNV